jgi:hypothetical protein
MAAVRTLLAALIVVSVMAPSVAVGATGPQQMSIAGTQIDADDVLLAAELQENGDAEWRIEYRIRLDNENSTDAFESVQQDIQQNPENYTQTFRDRMAATADSAETATGREMAIENVTVSAETRQLPREYGVVTYRFTWTNFANSEGSQLRAGDALAGLFLDSGTTLLLTWPEQYQLDSADPTPDDSSDTSVSWSGPREFGSDQPSVVLTSGTLTSASPIGLLPLVVLGLLVLAVVAGAVWYRRESVPPAESGGQTERDTASETETAPESGTAPATGTEPETDTGEEATATDSEETAESVPEELLSNEERVLQLLEERGGRMKQQQVVQELDWTEAKTSQVVGNLREEDKVETFRIGRENVLTLPGEDEL